MKRAATAEYCKKACCLVVRSFFHRHKQDVTDVVDRTMKKWQVQAKFTPYDDAASVALGGPYSCGVEDWLNTAWLDYYNWEGRG